MNWQEHILNNSFGEKEIPHWISPGGHIRYEIPDKYPQLPPPSVLKIEYPFILVDNWLVRLFPFTKTKMSWISESTARWAKQRPSREYKLKLLGFIEDCERRARSLLP